MPPSKKPTVVRTTPARKSKTTISFEYDGDRYSFDAELIPLDVLEDIDDGKFIVAMRGILGAEQWQTYKDKHPLAKDVEAFARALFDAMGNSPASGA